MKQSKTIVRKVYDPIMIFLDRIGVKAIAKKVLPAPVRVKLKAIKKIIIKDVPAALFYQQKTEYFRNKNDQIKKAKDYLNNIDADQMAMFEKEFGSKCENRFFVYPLSYPLEMVQRPNHFFRYFAGRGMKCVILTIDSEPFYIKKIADGQYVTNMFFNSIAYFQQHEHVFYLTYPYFGYLAQLMNSGCVIYDVVDDLTCFSGSQEALEEDHKFMLKMADHVIFSAQRLYDKNWSCVLNEPTLITNGVWPEDFASVKSQKIAEQLEINSDSKLIGYYGVVGDLIDWKLLDSILENPRLRLVMIGPIANFDNDAKIDKNQAKVFANPNFIHLPTVPYQELRKYLSYFDAGIIPFKINEITHSVSPLKMFEYMAAGIDIFATNTDTMREYKDVIMIGDGNQLINKINNWANKKSTRSIKRYRSILKKVSWKNQLDEFFKVIKFPEVLGHRVIGGRIDIANVNFFDWNGEILYKGGAERYVFDLAKLLQSKGHFPRILQNASKRFNKIYDGIEVIGVPLADSVDYRKMSEKYNEWCLGSDLVITSPMDLSCQIRDIKNIGINHGIYWDQKITRIENFNLALLRNIFDSLMNVDLGVCVDTNFINWTRTFDYGLAQKLKFIPNYFDKHIFKYTDKDFVGPIQVLYPRRMYEARGIFIALEAFDYLLNKYPDLTLSLVGQIDNKEVEEAVNNLMVKYDKQISITEYDMKDVYLAYRESHIVIIPTMYAEGTSLSAIEAMASNNAIVATNVGGLPNLVVDGYNGRLINPETKELINAVEELINDRHFLKKCAQNGCKMSKVFEKDRWLNLWSEAIEQALNSKL